MTLWSQNDQLLQRHLAMLKYYFWRPKLWPLTTHCSTVLTSSLDPFNHFDKVYEIDRQMHHLQIFNGSGRAISLVCIFGVFVCVQTKTFELELTNTLACWFTLTLHRLIWRSQAKDQGHQKNIFFFWWGEVYILSHHRAASNVHTSTCISSYIMLN